jgi:hypothetical protein
MIIKRIMFCRLILYLKFITKYYKINEREHLKLHYNAYNRFKMRKK